MLNRFAFSLLVLLIVASFVPLIAAAQGRPIGLADRKGGRDYALELELDWSNTGDDGTTTNAFLPKLYGSFGLSETLELEAELPTVLYDVSNDNGGGSSGFRLGNPFVALFYAARSDRSVARIGLGVALPVVSIDVNDEDSFETVVASGLAYATRGLREAWLYFPNSLSFVIPAQVQMRTSMLVIGLDAAIALMLSTDDEVRRDEVEATLDLGGLVGVALDDITLGMRLQLGSALTADGDRLQVSILPFIQADLDGGGFIHGGLLVALDNPTGVLGDNEADLWALRLGAGTRF